MQIQKVARARAWGVCIRSNTPARPTNAATEVPAASPSSPSVRLTALLSAVITNTASGENKTPKIRRPPPGSRRVSSDKAGGIGAGRANRAVVKADASASWTRSFTRGGTPLLDCCTIHITSSQAPSAQAPNVTPATAVNAGSGGLKSSASRTPAGTKPTPPIVGVPAFSSTCRPGPSFRTTWPALRAQRRGSSPAVQTAEASIEAKKATASKGLFHSAPPCRTTKACITITITMDHPPSHTATVFPPVASPSADLSPLFSTSTLPAAPPCPARASLHPTSLLARLTTPLFTSLP
mmetsp:Transcript_34098/g.47259  ORF Transcript_34098/g.47259 Transcript_34098/m.47259 type:complete len:295 (-) Transcript_34098:561-1445(-)